MGEELAVLECEVVTTRRGVDPADGAVAQAAIVGTVATAYDHWDSRVGDPPFHTHVVIPNRVKTVEDGRWRSLAGRPLHAVVVESAHHTAVLADRSSASSPRTRLGIEEDGPHGRVHRSTCASPVREADHRYAREDDAREAARQGDPVALRPHQ